MHTINEDGKIIDLFEPVESKNETNFWKCNDMCKIDEKTIFDRFHGIIEVILASTPEELIHFIDHIDDCPRISHWNKMIKEVDTSAETNENCGTSLPESLTTWEKLKYPNASRIYVYCSTNSQMRNDVEQNVIAENATDENCMECNVPIQKRMGHPHACYINYPENYGCTSQLLFFRTLAPHFPFIRNIVSSLYKIRRLLIKLTKIDTSIEELQFEELQKISNEIIGKAEENFVSSLEWPYAHESNIIEMYRSAFVALKKKNIRRSPNTMCFMFKVIS